MEVRLPLRRFYSIREFPILEKMWRLEGERRHRHNRFLGYGIEGGLVYADIVDDVNAQCFDWAVANLGAERNPNG